MEQRINVQETKPIAMKGLLGLGGYLYQSPFDAQLIDLIYFRVSQINGCARCLNMHAKDLRSKGETEQRLYVVNAWRETTLFTPRERAALAWAEAVTVLKDSNVPDEVYGEVQAFFTPEEIVDLTIATIAINSWNRLNIAFRAPVGEFELAFAGN